MHKNLLPLFLLAGAVLNCNATIHNVPGTYATIQTAINASVNGDTIAVLPGTYYENINYRGKNVVLTSMYYLAADTSYISTTIINGSTPVSADTASCVIFNSGEDSTAVLQGFTLTGGLGTAWTDIHGAGVYREGGGVLIELSAPTVTHNVIAYNIVTNLTGVVSTGGGGIRIGDGNPTICNNVIMGNQARYGAGVVLNYTGAKIRNNVIAGNGGGQQYLGGSGIWIVSNLGTTPKIIENNTIINNHASLASGTGGVSVWSASNVVIRNNIIWGNYPALQIKVSSATPAVTYCNVEGGYAGAGNINTNPLFDAQGYLLTNGSPCIDAGDSSAVYNDVEDVSNPGYALFPAKGLLRNDMGAYGGPCASVLPVVASVTALNETSAAAAVSVFPNPSQGIVNIVFSGNENKTALITVTDMAGSNVFSQYINNNNTQQRVHLNLNHVAKGIYAIKITGGKEAMWSRLVIN